jgi:hypothetical protein
LGRQCVRSILPIPTMPKKRAKPEPGPKPLVLKSDMKWEDGVKTVTSKRKPKAGWPKVGN